MPPVIEYEGVTKQYQSLFRSRRVLALQEFSLQVQPGEIFGFLGPNGAGKSTAIHLAMGFMRPTKGRGQMLGRPFGHARTRRRVGFLAENVSLYQRPADSLVRFYGALNGLRGAALKKRTVEVLAEVGLGAEARRNVKGFSRGMLQRVGLAQAIVNDPELLILDEPTSALDPRARVIVRELLMNFRNQGKTIFLSSHLLSEVELVCDRVAILNRGRMVRLGTTSSLLETSNESEILARGASAHSFGGVVLNNGDLRLAVPTSQQRTIVERIWQAGGEIISINPVRKSLEQLFLELTNLPNEKGTGK